jgi:hypothetical protein
MDLDNPLVRRDWLRRLQARAEGRARKAGMAFTLPPSSRRPCMVGNKGGAQFPVSSSIWSGFRTLSSSIPLPRVLTASCRAAATPRTTSEPILGGLRAGRARPYIRAMHLDLSDDEAAALAQELHEVVDNDRYPFSPRIRTLRAILAKLRPGAGARALAAVETEHGSPSWCQSAETVMPNRDAEEAGRERIYTRIGAHGAIP